MELGLDLIGDAHLPQVVRGFGIAGAEEEVENEGALEVELELELELGLVRGDHSPQVVKKVSLRLVLGYIEATRSGASIFPDSSECCWQRQVDTESAGGVHSKHWEFEDGVALGDYYCRCSDSVDYAQASSHFAAAPDLLHLGTPWFSASRSWRLIWQRRGNVKNKGVATSATKVRMPKVGITLQNRRGSSSRRSFVLLDFRERALHYYFSTKC